MRFLPILVMVFAGFFISIQGPINARLRLAVESPVLSAAISFLSGGTSSSVYHGDRRFWWDLGTVYGGCNPPRSGLISAARWELVSFSDQSSRFPKSGW